MAGLTAQGFVPKRLDEIKAEIEEAFVDVFGPMVLSPGSVAAQLIGSLTQMFADLWEIAEAVYYSQYAESAEGVNLDNTNSLVGVKRLGALASTVYAICLADEGTIIDAGSLVALVDTGEQFALVSDVTVTEDACHQALLLMADGSSPTYTVTVNGNAYSSVLTLPTAADDLQTLIEAGEADVTVAVEANGNDRYLRIQAADSTSPSFSIAVNANLTLEEVWTAVLAQAVETGPTPVVVGTVTEIITAVSGWNGVDNIWAGIEGRDAETDTEYRLRRALSIGLPGRGTVPSIEAQLLLVDGVTGAYVRENRTGGAALIRTNGGTYTSGSIGAYVNGIPTATVPYNTDRDTTLDDLATAITALSAVYACTYDPDTDLILVTMATNAKPTVTIVDVGVVGTLEFAVGDSIEMPGHSLNILVAGGTDADVAEAIWESKPAGVATVGDESSVIYDSSGQPQVIRFDRPTPLYAWASIEITLHPEEEFAADGLAQIKAAVAAYGDTLQPGNDYILQRLYGPIYSVSGIADATVQIAVTTGECDTPSYGTANIGIFSNEYLVFDEVRVIVSVA